MTTSHDAAARRELKLPDRLLGPEEAPRSSAYRFARSTGGDRATRAHAATESGATSATALTTSNAGSQIEATRPDLRDHVEALR